MTTNKFKFLLFYIHIFFGFIDITYQLVLVLF